MFIGNLLYFIYISLFNLISSNEIMHIWNIRFLEKQSCEFPKLVLAVGVLPGALLTIRHGPDERLCDACCCHYLSLLGVSQRLLRVHGKPLVVGEAVNVAPMLARGLRFVKSLVDLL